MVVRTYWQGYGWPWRGEGCITRLVETRSGDERKGRAEQEAAVGFGTVGATRTTAKTRGERRGRATGQRGWASVCLCVNLIQRVSITCTVSTRRAAHRASRRG